MKYLSYNQVSLLPKKSIVQTRSECIVQSEFLGRLINFPVMPANMRASIDFEKAKWLSENGYPYSLHRFYDYEEIFEWIRNNQNLSLISITIGVQQKDKEFLNRIVNSNLRVDWITIDEAHGHSIRMESMIYYIKSLVFLEKLKALSYSSVRGPVVAKRRFYPKIIAGNVATSEAVKDLADWGADAIKVGIGQGATCSTRLKTGFGAPMFTCIKECSKRANVPIIADGGIKEYGDAAKALVAGATIVMAGSIFAKCNDSPAEDFYVGDYNIKIGKLYKKWYGSASEHNKGEKKHVEGFEVTAESNGLTYAEMYEEWAQALKSSISYAGGYDLESIKKVDWVEL